jgi:L-2-amino-thiazoline-4-carboxylic acid hydrolase
MDKEGLAALDASIRNRALFYKAIYDEIRAEFGEKRATDILRRAIYKRGLEIGKPFARFAPGDFEGLKEAFLRFVPGGDAVFAPKVEHCDSDSLQIRLGRCPLRDAWQAMGLSTEEVEHLCHIAGAVDEGTFAAAGFAVKNTTWKDGRPGCCHLTITRRAP